MPEVRCSECPTTFHIAPSHLARLKRDPTCSAECKGKSMKGKGHWHWRKGEYVDRAGYVRVWTENGHRLKHRVVAEKHLGRPLREDEVVRHKDGDRENNQWRNLTVVTEGQERTARRKPRAARRRRAA